MIRLIQCREHQNVGVESFIGYPDDPNGGTERNGAVLGVHDREYRGVGGELFFRESGIMKCFLLRVNQETVNGINA
jgi:hypothetical protein